MAKLLVIALIPMMTPDELRMTAYGLMVLVGLILVVYGLQSMCGWVFRKLFPKYRD